MGIKRKFSGASGKGKGPSARAVAAFIAAAAKGNKDAVKRFCRKYPGHVDAADKSGNTALNAAALLNQVDVGNVLLFAGADPNKPALEGTSPFLTCVTTLRPPHERKDFRLLESMLMHHADVNFRHGVTGMTGLMSYSAYSDEKLCAFLLKHGINPTLKDKNGKTARDYALKMSDQLDGDSSYYELKEEIDHNILTLETAEKNWPKRPRPAKVLAAEASLRHKLLPN